MVIFDNTPIQTTPKPIPYWVTEKERQAILAPTAPFRLKVKYTSFLCLATLSQQRREMESARRGMAHAYYRCP